jgi:hypothetical protein
MIQRPLQQTVVVERQPRQFGHGKPVGFACSPAARPEFVPVGWNQGHIDDGGHRKTRISTDRADGPDMLQFLDDRGLAPGNALRSRVQVLAFADKPSG